MGWGRNGQCRKDERLGDFNCHESKQVGGSLRLGEQSGCAQLEKLGRALGAQSRASSPGRRREMSFRPFSSRGARGRA